MDSFQAVPAMMRLLVVGLTESAEMQPLSAALSGVTSLMKIDLVPDVDAAVDFASVRGLYPDLMIVCQHWPDEYTTSDVRQLVACVPMARLLCCYGPWCESDGRNRETWPAGARIPAMIVESRLRGEIDVLLGRRPPLPLTASRDETFDFNLCNHDSKKAHSPRTIQIRTPDRELERWLGELVTAAEHEYASATAEGTQNIATDVILWDLDPWDARRLASEFRQIQSAFDSEGEAPAIIGLMGLPYPEDLVAARSLGMKTILHKLAPSNEIVAAIAWASSARFAA
jgi:hypothetical protein